MISFPQHCTVLLDYINDAVTVKSRRSEPLHLERGQTCF